MNLQCKVDLAAKYKAGSQIARVLSEDWCARELYCPACDSDRLVESTPNTEAVDFQCATCEQPYQLKSQLESQRNRSLNTSGEFPPKIPDAGYEAMIRAIRGDKTPNLLLLQYTKSWLVQNLLLVPRMFFVESVIEKRKPLGPHARRAGWVGCNILLSEIPSEGKITIISAGVPSKKSEVRREFSRVKDLAELPPSLRGWTLDVLRAVRTLGKGSFSLHELYEFEPQLKERHPNNGNVKAKIRQQLQVLRNLGMIRFSGKGTYVLPS